MVKPNMSIGAFEKQQPMSCKGTDSQGKRMASPTSKQPSSKKQNVQTSSASISLKPKPDNQSTDKPIVIADSSNSNFTTDPRVTVLAVSQTLSDGSSIIVTEDSSEGNSTMPILPDQMFTDIPTSNSCPIVILEGDHGHTVQAINTSSFDSAYCSAVSGNEQQLRNAKEENDRLKAQVMLLTKMMQADDGKAAAALLANKLDKVEGKLNNMENHLCSMSGRLENVESKLPHLDNYSKVTQWLEKSDFTSSI